MEDSLSKRRSPSNVIDFDVEIASDISPEAYRNTSSHSYSDNGVQLQDTANSLRLVYNGILAKDGAQNIYAVLGYGNNLKWNDVEYYPMNKAGHQAFELVFPIKKSGNINLAFKDGAGNWDNNSNMNYSFYDDFNEGSS